MDRPLSDRCALVTGSTSGIGLATAERLAALGCDVVLTGLGAADAVSDARERVARHGGRIVYSDANLADPARIQQLVTAALETFGAVHILVNNAVVRHAAPVEAFTREQWDEAMAVNLSAAFHTIRLTLPAMRAAGWGRIVNVSSIYGLRGAPNRVGYVTTKTALLGLTRAVAMETVGQNITCNTVCPGTVDTAVHQATIASMTSTTVSREDAVRQFMRGKQPTGRLITPESIADVIAFLCGPGSEHVTGAALPIDDGWSAG
jgi:3-hydroxybutyrate dehydrogenase